MQRRIYQRAVAGLVLALVSAAASGGIANASEKGTSVYLLGSGGPATAMMPPVEGVFLANTTYYLSGRARAERLLPVGGSVVAGLDATVLADFPTLLWVPSTDTAGGTLALGLTTPIGRPDVTVEAVISGPLGGVAGASLSDDAVVLGDPILTAMLGWSSGNYHVQASAMVNVPIGHYRDGELANLAFKRWTATFTP